MLKEQKKFTIDTSKVFQSGVCLILLFWVVSPRLLPRMFHLPSTNETIKMWTFLSLEMDSIKPR